MVCIERDLDTSKNRQLHTFIQHAWGELAKALRGSDSTLTHFSQEVGFSGFCGVLTSVYEKSWEFEESMLLTPLEKELKSAIYDEISTPSHLISTINVLRPYVYTQSQIQGMDDVSEMDSEALESELSDIGEILAQTTENPTFQGWGLYRLISRIRIGEESDEPNCCIVFEDCTPEAKLIALRDIKAGEELVLGDDYDGEDDDDDDNEILASSSRVRSRNQSETKTNGGTKRARI
mmetsp:Transcript_31682/g.55681  ORF Transcript_31682/g.55681 Transcript_31682/m.55681 type:complete len:235 (+) Transcript_31682:3-707(+)